jgi:WS/DGAT C-terminal domain
MNTYAANVPGPPVPLYFAGAPVLELFPVVPLMANVSVGVGALSYAGQFNLTAVADRELCPDLEVFADGARRSLDALATSVRVHAGDHLLSARLAAPDPLHLPDRAGAGELRRLPPVPLPRPDGPATAGPPCPSRHRRNDISTSARCASAPGQSPWSTNAHGGR